MKHIFVVNPAAGSHDCTEEVQQNAEKYFGESDFEIYRTAGPGDATEFVKNTCAGTDEECRFYACGGDGTLNEVVRGCIGFDNASITVYPCGSGNDYIKYYGKYDDFKDMGRLVNGTEHKVDLMKIGDNYSINIVNFGFDVSVVKTMLKVKRKKLLGGKRAYFVGVASSVITAMKTPCKVTVDGERIGKKDKMLLCTVANGKYVGGSFKCAPRSKNDDGLLEVCFVNPVSRFTFIRLLGAYTNGTHLDDKRFTDKICYKQGRIIEIEAGPGFDICVDGELVAGEKFTVEVVPGAIRFVEPQALAEEKEREAVVS